MKKVRFANKKITKKKCDDSINNQINHFVYNVFEGFVFVFGEDALVEEHEAQLDQAQTRYLHQLD